MKMGGALKGIRVIELGRYIAAPYCCKLLADLGADVVKIEDPAHGDPMRIWQDGDRPYSPQFAAYNRGKRAITLDLKQDRGRTLLLAMIAEADVLVENFRAGVMERLNLDWESLSKQNPHLVYCSITGFGQSGPYIDRPAYDTVISAMSGIYGMLIDTATPRPVGPAFSDLLSGQFAALGVLAALNARSRTKQGQRLDVSMLGAVLGFITEAATSYLDAGEITRRDTRQRRAQAYGLVAADSLPFVVHLSVPDKFWVALTDAMDIASLREDARFSTRSSRFEHYEELEAALQLAARHRTRKDWMRILEEADVPHAPINSLDEVFEDPQVKSMNLIEEIPVSPGERPARMAGRFAEFSQTPMTTRRLAPKYGEHTEEILGQVGVDPQDLENLRRAGVI